MPFANAHGQESNLRKLHFANRAYSFTVLLYLAIKMVVVAVSMEEVESRARSKQEFELGQRNVFLLHDVCRLQVAMI